MRIKKFISESPIFAMYQVQRFVLESFQDRLSVHGVHLLQGLILTSIFFEERAVRPLELAAIFNVERSNLSHALRGLERKGLVKRLMHPSDARGYVFELSPAGRKKTIALVKEFDLVQNTMEAKLGTRKSSDLVDALQKFTAEYQKSLL